MDMSKVRGKAEICWKPSRICRNMFKVIKKIMRGSGNPRNNKMISTSSCFEA
jgi:hypothetical protein